MPKSLFILVLFLCACLPDNSSNEPSAQVTVPADFIWPLCGHIYLSAPTGWSPLDNCPTNRHTSAFHDGPLSSTYGPRQLANEDLRYDFHRGIDIPAPLGSPVFAIANGKVTRAGAYEAYQDPIVILRHYDETSANCEISNCLHSLYFHLSNWVVNEGDDILKGQLIAYTGASSSGFAHLHFEIREVPSNHNITSALQRDAIHPIKYLATENTNANNISLSFKQIDKSNSLQPNVTLTVTINHNIELDFNRLEIALFEKTSSTTLTPVIQSGESPTGLTPEGTGYLVSPPFYDMQQLNRQYTYQDTNQFPWAAFEFGGIYESPFHDLLPTTYNANAHMDNTLEGNNQIGSFNGFEIFAERFNATTQDYILDVTFKNLNGISNPDILCIKARAIDAKGNTGLWIEDNC